MGLKLNDAMGLKLSGKDSGELVIVLCDGTNALKFNDARDLVVFGDGANALKFNDARGLIIILYSKANVVKLNDARDFIVVYDDDNNPLKLNGAYDLIIVFYVYANGPKLSDECPFELNLLCAARCHGHCGSGPGV